MTIGCQTGICCWADFPELSASAQSIIDPVTYSYGNTTEVSPGLVAAASEVSPRPHDTGMVTMISQDLSVFALHARAVLGLPIPEVHFFGPSASKAVVVEGNTREYEFCNLDKVVEEPGVQIRIFGKPEIVGHRRLGVILATADTVEEARAKAERAYAKLQVKVY